MRKKKLNMHILSEHCTHVNGTKIPAISVSNTDIAGKQTDNIKDGKKPDTDIIPSVPG